MSTVIRPVIDSDATPVAGTYGPIDVRRESDTRVSDLIARALPGVRVPDGVTSVAECLSLADACFSVETRGIMAVLNAEEAVEIPGKVATIRTDTGAPLGVVGDSYGVVQTLSAFDTANVLAERGEFAPFSVQSLDAGRRIRLNGTIGGGTIQRLDGAADVLAHVATFETSHDGSCGVAAHLQTIRLACHNGMTVRDKRASVKVRHTANASKRIDAAMQTVFTLRDRAGEELATFQGLASSPMSLGAFQSFAESLLDAHKGELDEESSGNKATRRQNEIAELCNLFSHGRGNSGASMWDGFNAVTEWIDHQRSRKDAAKRFESGAFGAGNKVKGRALRMLTR